jgi:hypothetical protein
VTGALRASVGSTEAAKDVVARVGVVGPTRARSEVAKADTTWHPSSVDPIFQRTALERLNRHGPYSQRDLITRPQVCVICQRTKKGQVEHFIQKLKQGINNPALKKLAFDRGMLGKYSLEEIETKFFYAETSSSDGYKRAIKQALEQGGPRGPNWNLALVQIDERFHELHGENNPYLVSKAVAKVRYRDSRA